MKPGTNPRTQVLVVGAGPVGLLTAVELRQRGVAVRIIDGRLGPAETTRALSLWGRAADILERSGVDRQTILSHSIPIRRLTYFDGRDHLATFRLPASAACRTLPQQETEALLVDRLRELGGAVEWGTALTSIRPDHHDSGVCAQVEVRGAVESIEAGYLVGADGARSTVRATQDIAFEGSTYEQAFSVVDARIGGHLPDDACFFYQTHRGPLVIVPIGDGVFRFLTIAGQGVLSGSGMQEVVAQRGPAGVSLGEVVSEAIFTVHAREAQTYSRGRVFLAGDAAHVHSPAGGQGMNNGMQDAHNLAWKLASVLLGGAPERILDSYDSERRPATQRIIADTQRQTALWMFENPWAKAARNTLFRVGARSGLASRLYAPVMAGYRVRYPVHRPEQLPSGRRPCRGVNAVGRFLRQAQPAGVLPWRLAVHGGDELMVTRLRKLVAARSERIDVDFLPGDVRIASCHRPGYYLVRPDEHVQAHGHTADFSRLSLELDWWGL